MKIINRLNAGIVCVLASIVTIAIAAIGSIATGHDIDNPDGHVPPNTNYGFEVVGRDVLGGIETGLYTDVWSHDGYAYIGTFQEPECSSAGVFVVDIAAAISNYAGGDISGATVAQIKSAPNTRINDVKVHTVGDKDVLITTQEPCGSQIPGAAVADENINKNCPIKNPDCNRNNPNRNPRGPRSQVGQGGISLYDVSNPRKPKALRKNFLEFEGVHNTFAWTTDEGSYLIGVADTFDFQDTFIVDISKPQRPKLLTLTGVLDWLDDGFSFNQLETGTFGAILLHDVWVNEIDGVPTAVLSYWDAGFITLDVSDPANPVFLGDSDYPDPDPITGLPYEGNAHAAVFGGDNGQYIFGGDEDFDPFEFGISFEGVAYAASGASFGPANAAGIGGNIVWTGGTGCTAADVPPAPGDGGTYVALIQRGDCFFQDKAESAAAQGYDGYIVANDAARGDGLISMGPRDTGPYPDIPGAFVGYSTGETMKGGGLVDGTSELFNGWGYFHVLNNTNAEIQVPDQQPGDAVTIPVGYLGEIGYYAPAETVEAEFTPGNGDLTMHNVEADPLTQDVTPTFNSGPRSFISWYSLGMRAVEYRPGHYHNNSRGEGSYSWNVHEVGRFIADDGSNFWGVHVDEINGQQIILGSDRNTGLWIFTFDCETRIGEETFYCDGSGGSGSGG